jgi:hypothetical protein
MFGRLLCRAKSSSMAPSAVGLLSNCKFIRVLITVLIAFAESKRFLDSYYSVDYR